MRPGTRVGDGADAVTCAFVACDAAVRCCLPGGCITQRFGKLNTVAQDEVRCGARKLAGEKHARTNRDPALIKRTRKRLVP